MKKLLVLLLAFAAFAVADDGKISRELKGKTGDGPVDVIVQYKIAPKQSHKDRIVSYSGQVKSDLELVKGVTASVPANKVGELSDDPDVAFVSPDRTLHPSLNYVTAAAGASYAWQQGYNGS